MSESLPQQGDAARSRFRSAVTTVLLLMIAVMIVRDIFARRWGSSPPPASGVTQRAP
ncbi:hypothetical protein ACFIOY_11355 [Bradyrhizobium sp. TZ2]